jgi:hypothetical protein
VDQFLLHLFGNRKNWKWRHRLLWSGRRCDSVVVGRGSDQSCTMIKLAIHVGNLSRLFLSLRGEYA